MSAQRILVLTCLCHMTAVLLFIYAYFPIQNIGKAGFSSINDLPAEPGSTFTTVDEFYPRMVGKTVLFVIDALRADFIFDKKRIHAMPYVQSLLLNKTAFATIAKVQPPTVTLPRLKAMTTGTIPGYVDVVMNFGASQLLEDHLLHQAKKSGLKSVFYGDDTWIRLFPNYFIRSEGTTSFFVTDFKEVDDNVTRHLDSELKKDDWDLLILHYLGLDHIGHVHGPHHSLIEFKLMELDKVIQLIHTTLIGKNTNKSLSPLIVICGDHGINDDGSHGGSSASETHIPFIFTLPFSEKELKKWSYEDVNQVDLAPTLSVLLGIPIPKNNIGKIIPDVLNSLEWRKRLYLTYMNTHFICQLVLRHASKTIENSCVNFARIKQEHRRWLLRNCTGAKAECDDHAETITKSYYKVMSDSSASLTSQAISYDHYAMIVSIIVQWLALAILVIFMLNKANISFGINNKIPWIFASILLVQIYVGYYKVFGESLLSELQIPSIMVVLSCAFLMSQSLGDLCSVFRESRLGRLYGQRLIKWPNELLQELKMSALMCWFILAVIAHSISLASSSFVEEEHFTWYYFTTTALFIELFRLGRNFTAKRSGSNTDYLKQIAMLSITILLFRLGRNWNSTGDHWIYLEDVGDWINKSGNETVLFFSTLGSIFLIVAVRTRNQKRWTKILSYLIGFLLCSYHIGSNFFLRTVAEREQSIPPNQIARIVMVLNAILLVSGLLQSRWTRRSDKIANLLHDVNSFWLFLAVLLSRPHNLTWLAMLSIQDYLMLHNLHFKELSVESATLMRLFMAKSSFFQQGNSNNLSRIDLVGGYVGLDTYQPVLIGILLTCSTYSSSIFWITSLASHICKYEPHRFSKGLMKACLILLMTQILIWSFYMIFASILRYHLFVWTVFSPKLLFEGAYSVIILLIILYFNLLRIL